jgi:asparagine synthase (glutamine-hydrolysing)
MRASAVPAACRGLAAAGGAGLAGRVAAMNTLSLARPGAGYTNAESWLGGLDALLGDAARGTPGHDPAACRSGAEWTGGRTTAVRQVLFDDFQVLLPDDYLTKVDVASMAASLEVRAPFLSHHVMELAWSLPDRLKLNLGRRKWLLKRVAARLVPPEVIYRPKQGFGLPMKRWWRGRLAEVLQRLMATSRAVEWGWIRREPVLRALDEHRRGVRDHETRLWLVLWLELWARIAYERSVPRGASLLEIE